MNQYYVTYAFGSNLKDKFSLVLADSYGAARDLIFAGTQGAFAFVYDEADFAEQQTIFGLEEAPLQAQVMIE